MPARPDFTWVPGPLARAAGIYAEPPPSPPCSLLRFYHAFALELARESDRLCSKFLTPHCSIAPLLSPKCFTRRGLSQSLVNRFYCKKHERGGLSYVEFLLAQLLSASVVLVGEVQLGSVPLEVVYDSMQLKGVKGDLPGGGVSSLGGV